MQHLLTRLLLTLQAFITNTHYLFRIITYSLLLMAVCMQAVNAHAQQDSINISIVPQADTTKQAANVVADSTKAIAAKVDTVLKKKKVFEPKPKKAGMYSAILPGSGQFYNRQYWKVPVIYAGVAAAGYFFLDNQSQYQKFRKAYYARIDNDPNTIDTDISTTRYTTDNLKQLQDEYRRFLDLTVLFTTLGYTIQVIDAIAAAHLKNFDISRDISFRVQPVVHPNYVGMGLAVNFK
ncbi:hypothetical protein CAP35_07150 [Chitinophagaceae bacterium IBVUCB1]|nr:hypothetical protein CAP35_07150 [Chitinophagaceae bacterium IBVUCB1]